MLLNKLEKDEVVISMRIKIKQGDVTETLNWVVWESLQEV